MSIETNASAPAQSFFQRLGLWKEVFVMLALFYILTATENRGLVFVIGIVPVFVKWRKTFFKEIADTVKIEVSNSNERETAPEKLGEAVTVTVFASILKSLLIYFIAVTFLLTIIPPFVCGAQDVVNIGFFSKKFCKQSSEIFLETLRENSQTYNP